MHSTKNQYKHFFKEPKIEIIVKFLYSFKEFLIIIISKQLKKMSDLK